MESTRRRVARDVVGVFLAGGVHAVDNRTGLSDETESLPVHVHHVHHLDRHQFVRRVLDVVRMRWVVNDKITYLYYRSRPVVYW